MEVIRKSEDAEFREKENEVFYEEHSDFESFKKELYEKIKIGLKQVREGKGRPARECFKELEEKYNL